MKKNPRKFADLLTQALYRSKAKENKNIGVIEDELGHTLGRNGGEFIRYLRRGNIPSKMSDVEQLAQELVRRGGFDRRSCEQFLHSADHQLPPETIDAWFGKAAETMSDTKTMPDLKPFVVGPPITQLQQFFGRERELKHIFDRWQGFPMEHIAVIGPRRSGKTSLLHYVSRIAVADETDLRPDQRADWLADPQRYRWIFIDFQDIRMQALNGLLRHLLTALDLPTPDPCDLETFMDLVSDYDGTQLTIIVMDELGAGLLAPELDQSFWWSLRSLANSAALAGRIAFLVAAQDHPAQLAEDRGKTSPFFNMFTTLELGPFTEEEARDLIDSSPTPFAPADVDWIIEHSHRWPCTVQILCQERLAALREGDTSDDWQAAGLQRSAPFRYLWE